MNLTPFLVSFVMGLAVSANLIYKFPVVANHPQKFSHTLLVLGQFHLRNSFTFLTVALSLSWSASVPDSGVLV